jgi:hypothetical protein
MKLLKTIILSVALISLFSCSERLSPKRSDAGQQQVKQQVVKLLEEEYKQPFELESFDYEYKTQYPNASGNKPYTTFGVFNFKIKAINNPVIIMDFDFRDDKKDSIKDSLLCCFN